MFDQCLTNAMKASINKGGSFMATPTNGRMFFLSLCLKPPINGGFIQNGDFVNVSLYSFITLNV
jgi:hypothetical protein